jgi:predicted nicotinamide N-methyase
MISVPCSIVGSIGDDFPESMLNELIQPPNVETLYDWYVNIQRKPDADPSWAVVWPTAVTLANHLLTNPELVRGKRVVELGSGLGLAGLTAALQGATEVMLTDREPFALHCGMSTAALHPRIMPQVRAAVLDWNDEEIAANLRNSFHVILASDVLYDRECIEAFVNICTKVAAPTGACVLLTDPSKERAPRARQMLRDALRQVKGDVQIEEHALPIPQPQEGGEASTIDGKDHSRRMQEPTLLLKFEI